MSWNKTIPFSEGLEQLKNEAKEGKPAPGKPSQLRRSEIRMAHSVFQPRMFEGSMDQSDRHIATLKDAIVNAKGHQLDPITVWWSGKHWRPVDGHHRLLAYQQLADDRDRPLLVEEILVDVFDGTLGEAIAEAVRLNSRDKLPMSKEDKIERAWKLVAAKVDMSKAQIASAAGVSPRSVAIMRNELKAIEAEGQTEGDPLTDMRWRDVLKGRRELPDRDDVWQERQARDWARRLAKAFGTKPTKMPSIFAGALELYSEQLSTGLKEHWRDEADTSF